MSVVLQSTTATLLLVYKTRCTGREVFGALGDYEDKQQRSGYKIKLLVYKYLRSSTSLQMTVYSVTHCFFTKR